MLKEEYFRVVYLIHFNMVYNLIYLLIVKRVYRFLIFKLCTVK